MINPFKPGDFVMWGQNGPFEVADTMSLAGFTGIYDEPPGHHIDFLQTKNLKRYVPRHKPPTKQKPVKRKLFMCVGCQCIYSDEPVTRCDCMCEPEFIEGTGYFPDKP